MQLKKLFRGLLIAVPVVTMMACSSTSDDELSAQEAQQRAEQQAAAEAQARQEAEAAAAAEARRLADIEARETRDMLASLQQDQVVYFEFDTANLTSAARAILDRHADFLAKNSGQSVVVEGHCDRRGTPEYNIALGERRAKSVETYLLNSGVSASQLSVVSYGEEKPAANGSTEAAFAQNRRGVLVYQ
ncbi:MAG: peptidoglycan-associated lipoprotein Pal [Aliiglaciecola sp.]|uniref:peptidoglycan-associated lipoprotein Pal n=1 Tax=Aliiglaciecola sp. M165 TaxID=2593649 RepID=UPI00117C18F7|nr:peptidoglycan-associated lipoprotein Pal [Aliiglaciecola sp. M165]TRY31037.1 peptidoglycan-associated lipoprotein Pal [Aliiglaciecola sp. M165]